MLASFFNKSVIVRRLKTSSGSKKSFLATATADTHYQNIQDEDSLVKEGVPSKSYKAWFDPGEDIQSGDELQDAVSGTRFRVVQVENISDGFGLEAEHLEVIMTKHTG